MDFNGSTALIKWQPGYDGGYPQQMEVWYRLSSANDYEWRSSSYLPPSVTSHQIPNLQLGQMYLFSVRGINREGAGHFSDIVEAKGLPLVINHIPKKSGKLSGYEIICLGEVDSRYIGKTFDLAVLFSRF